MQHPRGDTATRRRSAAPGRDNHRQDILLWPELSGGHGVFNAGLRSV